MLSSDSTTALNKTAKTKAPALKKAKQAFTQLLIASFQCPYGKSQALYWDKATPNLGLRVTANGYKSYIFESSLNNKTVRITLGSIQTCPLSEARERTSALKSLVNKGIDPRKLSGRKAAPFISKKALADQSVAPQLPQQKLLPHQALAAWFAAVDQMQNPEMRAYLKVLLLSGRRKKEVANLTWDDIDVKQQAIAIKQQDGTRSFIPLTQQIKALLTSLPNSQTFIFNHTISQYEAAHHAVCQAIKLPLTLDTLRTSFTLYSDLVETPFGITAQLQDIDVIGIAANQFSQREMPVLQTWHQKIESWILAKVQ